VGHSERAEESEDDVIELQEVVKTYPDGTEAVRGVTFEIPDGELCVLVGPSGCGKTTTMKMVNRLVPITSGTIRIDGEDNRTLNATQLRRRIGYAIQEIGLFPHMTVAQNVATVPRLLHWPKERARARAEELLDLVGLTPADAFADRYPRELSGGQRQRVGVARSLGADPSVLLMDEPFGAIDPINRDKLQNEFLKIQREIRKTIVFVTHDINEAIKMGDRIALMRDGILIQYDTPEALLSRPANAFVRDFVGADRALKGLRLMRVRDVMRRNPPTVQKDAPIEVARRALAESGRPWLIVIDDGGRFHGWITGDEVASDGESVSDVMIPAMASASEDDVLNEALSMMLMAATGNLAIVDDHDRLQGVLTFGSIRRVLGETYLSDEESDASPAGDGGSG